MINKESLRGLIVEKLQADLALQVSAAQLARDEATSEESRAENKYDTHSQEAAYLAEGQAKLAAEIEASIAFHGLLLPSLGAAAPIEAGALIELTGRDGANWYFLGPRAGGLEVDFEGRTVLVVTPQSPVGRALLGRRPGEEVIVGRSLQKIASVS